MAVATIAAVPLLVLENPNSLGSVTSTAGATETSLAATTATIAAPVISESSGIVFSNPEEETSQSRQLDETQAVMILAEAKAKKILKDAVEAKGKEALSIFETAETVSVERAEELADARIEYIESQGSASPTTLPPYVPPAPDGTNSL